MGELQEVVPLFLGALAVMLLVRTVIDIAGDYYSVLLLPGRLPRVFRMWFAPGAEVYHPEVGRCEVARLDRRPDLGLTWVCIQPLDEEEPGWVPAACWVPLNTIGETPEEAELLDNLDDPGDPPVGGGPW